MAAAAEDSSPDIKVDYRVFIGRDPEPAGEGEETEIPAEAYRRRRMLRFEGEQTRRSPRVENKAEISPSAGAGGVAGVGGGAGGGGAVAATTSNVDGAGATSFEFDFQPMDDPFAQADDNPRRASQLLENYASDETVIYKEQQTANDTPLTGRD